MEFLRTVLRIIACVSAVMAAPYNRNTPDLKVYIVRYLLFLLFIFLLVLVLIERRYLGRLGSRSCDFYYTRNFLTDVSLFSDFFCTYPPTRYMLETILRISRGVTAAPDYIPTLSHYLYLYTDITVRQNKENYTRKRKQVAYLSILSV